MQMKQISEITPKKPWYRMSVMTCFLLNLCSRMLEKRYYCYGLFKSYKINLTLLYAILPAGIIGCLIMFKFVPKADTFLQWDVNFITDSVQKFLMAMLIHMAYKKTRHAAMATAVLVYFIFDLFYSIKGVYMKMWWFSLGFKLMLAVMATFVIAKHIRTAKKIKDKNDETSI